MDKREEAEADCDVISSGSNSSSSSSSTSTCGTMREERRLYEYDEGWSYAVGVASFVTHALMATIYFGYSVLTPAWVHEFETTSGMTSLVGSAASGFSSGLAPIGSYLSNRYDHRTTHMIGGIIASIGIFACSFANNLQQIFVFYGFFGGLGIGICYLPAVMVMKEFFKKKYALFMGFASCGIGVGSCVFPLIIEKLEDIYGWRGTMLILSGVMLNMCVSAAIMFPNPVISSSSSSSVSQSSGQQKGKRKLKQQATEDEINGNFLSQEQLSARIEESNANDIIDIEFHEKSLLGHKSIDQLSDSTKSNSISTTSSNTSNKKTFLELTVKTLKNPYFMLGVVSNFTNFVCMMLVIGLTPMRAQFELGMSPEQGAMLASAIGFSNMLARFLWGAICNMNKRIDPLTFFLWLRVVTAMVTMASIYGQSFEIQLAFCIFLGAGFGNWSLYPIYIPLQFDQETVDAAFGYLEVFNGFGCLVGPFIGGYLYDRTSTFKWSLITAGVCLLLGTVFMHFGHRMIQRQRKLLKQQQQRQRLPHAVLLKAEAM